MLRSFPAFQKVGAVLVECLYQCLILATDTLIGIAYHFSRYKCLPVGNALVVFDDLRLDIVKREVDVPCLAALPFRLVAFHVPKRLGNALLATELCHSPVDCNPSHNGDNTVFLLAAVHVEQHFECASCHTRFFDCKVKYQRVRPCKPTEATSCQFRCHVLKITFRRVTI